MVQSVDDETLLFDSATGMFFGLNEMGRVMWECMREQTSFVAVVDILAEEYDVDRGQLSRDVLDFAVALEAQKLIDIEK